MPASREWRFPRRSPTSTSPTASAAESRPPPGSTAGSWSACNLAQRISPRIADGKTAAPLREHSRHGDAVLGVREDGRPGAKEPERRPARLRRRAQRSRRQLRPSDQAPADLSFRPNVLLVSKHDPSRLWTGLFDGLESFRWVGGKWIEEGRVDGAAYEARSLSRTPTAPCGWARRTTASCDSRSASRPRPGQRRRYASITSRKRTAFLRAVSSHRYRRRADLHAAASTTRMPCISMPRQAGSSATPDSTMSSASTSTLPRQGGFFVADPAGTAVR